MKYIFFVLIFTLSLKVVYSQDSLKKIITTRTEMRSRALDTNQLIYDEQGNALRYYQYTKLINTGMYTIRFKGGRPGDPGVKGKIEKISEEESLSRYEMFKSQFVVKSPFLREGEKLDLTPLLNTFTETELNKKAIVLIFWYADCPPCTEGFDSINEYLKTVINRDDMVIIAITKDTEPIAQAKLIEKPLLYARLLSNGNAVNNFYQLRTFPSYVVADKDHIIRFSTSGAAPMTMPVFKSTIGKVLTQ